MDRRYGSFLFGIFFVIITIVFGGILLQLHFKGPDEIIYLHQKDQQMLRPVSTTWCSSLEIHSEYPINAFMMTGDPKLHFPDREQQNLDYEIPPGMHGYDLARYLTIKSKLKLHACTRGFRSYFALIRGEKAAEKCQKALKKMSADDEDDSKKKIVSGRDVIKSFIPHGPFDLEKRKDFVQLHRYCPQALVFSILQEKQDQFQGKFCKPDEDGGYELNIPADDKYVFLTGNLGKKNPVFVNISLDLERARYDLSPSKYACLSTTICKMPIDIGYNPKIVVSPTTGTDFVIQDTTKVIVICRPRLTMYAMCYGAIPMLILLLLGCFGSMCCKSKKQQYSYVYLEEREGARMPLLGGNDEKQRPLQPQPPVHNQPSPPPPYYDPERQDVSTPSYR